ncbi:6-bladed beta-propeller [Vibrio maerlii]|uniref:6-bladed beta-propeller n=1 Tax=Vibrio maerlii TaxID=2231648 RepID=UPI000E3E71CC|nr:6-bladed beta-propeller [Vibrio maerlii]
MPVTPTTKDNFIVDNQWASVPEHIKIDNCHELAQSKDGRIFLSADHPDNNIIIFSPEGDFLESWTLGYDGCHGLTLFEQGEHEYLLITQTGVTEIDGIVKKGLGEVVKTDLKGNVLHTFANPFELGIYPDELTYNPTETCVAPNGDIYIADGYGASYIHSFTQQGEYQFSFGGSELAPDNASLINPHGITIDPRFTDINGNPLLVVSSRKQSKFKHFTLTGEFVHSTHLPGAYPCRAVINGDHLYSGVCWSGPIVSDDDLTNYANRLDESGFVIVLDKQGRVVEAIGAQKPEYIDDSLQPLNALSDSPFAHIHDVLPLSDGSMLISQWRGHQTLPYRIQPKNL